jgi:tetratricopeptide (TPR) repeat protein
MPLASPPVFISYSSRNQREAEILVEGLCARDISCWMAPRSIPSGANWADEIESAVRAAKIMVSVVSPEFNESTHTRKEMILAADQGLEIVPILISDFKPWGYLRYFLCDRQWIVAVGEQLTSKIDVVAKAIEYYMGTSGRSPAAMGRPEPAGMKSGRMLGMTPPEAKLELSMPRPVHTKTMQPSQWLQAHNAFVPLIGRESDITEFLAFTHEPGLFRWQVCFGEGGMGKTRLAIELARRAMSEGWYAGFISGDKLKTFVNADTLGSWRPCMPTFIVVDYAASKTANLRRLFEHFATLEMEADQDPDAPPTEFPIRVLLLERHGDNTNGWLREVLTAGEGAIADYLRNICYLGVRQLQPPGGSSDNKLKPIDITRKMVENTFASWAERTGRQPPTMPAFSDLEWRNMQVLTGNRPLYVQMAAIHACDIGSAAGLPTWGRSVLLGAAVARERYYVNKECPDLDLLRALEHTTAMLCLTGTGASQDSRWLQSLDQELGRIGVRSVTPNTLELRRRAIFDPPRWSATEGEVGIIQPDIVSEGFAASVLREEHDPPLETLRQILNLAGIKAWSNLVRMVQDLTGLDGFANIDAWLPLLLVGRPLDELRQLLQLLPERSATLHEFGLCVGEQILERIPQTASRERAECLLALGNHRLRGHADSIEEQKRAEAEVREAGEIFRAMAGAEPDVPLRLLCSRADHVLSMTLSNQNLPQQAATAAFNAAATASGRDPTQNTESMPTVDEINTLPIPDNVDLVFAMAYGMNDLAISSSTFTELARQVTAGKRAVEAGERLVSFSWTRFASDLARFNHNYSNALWAADRKQEAIETCRHAVKIGDECARANPDEYALSLGLALGSLVSFEYNMGNNDDAKELCEQMITVYTELSSRNPGQYRAKLAQAYHNVGYLTSDASKEISLHYTLEGLKIRQELIELDFDAYALALAWSYHNAGCDLEENDGIRSLEYLEKAYRLRTQWAERHPGVDVPEIPKVASLLAAQCRRMNDKESELRWLNVTIQDSEKYGHDSADSLHDAAIAFGRLGETERAGDAAHRSADVRRPVYAAQAQNADGSSADLACNFASALDMAGDWRADESELMEAIDVSSTAIRRIECTPERKAFVWGALLNNLGHAQFRLGELHGDTTLVETGIETLVQSIAHHESLNNQSAMAETQELLDRARGVLVRMTG